MNRFVVVGEGDMAEDHQIVASTGDRVHALRLVHHLNEEGFLGRFQAWEDSEESVLRLPAYRKLLVTFELDGPRRRMAKNVEVVERLIASNDARLPKLRAQIERVVRFIEDEDPTGVLMLYTDDLLGWLIGEPDAVEDKQVERQLQVLRDARTQTLEEREAELLGKFPR